MVLDDPAFGLAAPLVGAVALSNLRSGSQPIEPRPRSVGWDRIMRPRSFDGLRGGQTVTGR